MLLSSTLDSLLLQWPGMVQGKFQRLAWRLISSSITWGIWLLRNKIVCDEGTISLFDCFSTILHRVTIWLYTLYSNFTYIGNDFLRSFDDIKLWCNKKSQVVFFCFLLQQIIFVFFLFFFFLSCKIIHICIFSTIQASGMVHETIAIKHFLYEMGPCDHCP